MQRYPSIIAARLTAFVCPAPRRPFAASVNGRFRSISLALCLLVLAAGALAQSTRPEVISLGTAMAPLNGPWKFTPGDSPVVGGAPLWAQPDMDDSGWDSLDLRPPSGSFDPQFDGAAFGPGWTRRGYPNLRRFAWYRLRVRVESKGQQPWLDMPLNVDDAYQVFANGRLLGEFGIFGKGYVLPSYSRAVAVALPPSPDGTYVIAIRFYMMDYSPLRWLDAGGMHVPPMLGLEQAIATRRSLEQNQLEMLLLGDFVTALLYLLALPAVVWAALANREDPAWFWLAWAVSAETLGGVTALAARVMPGMPMVGGEVLSIAICSPLIGLFFFIFWWRWLALERHRWLIPTAFFFTFVNIGASLILVSPSAGIPVASLDLLSACSMIADIVAAAMGVLTVLLLVLAYRKNAIAALLATLPLLLLVFGSLYIPLLVLFRLSPQITFGGVAASFRSVAAFVMLLLISGLAAHRFIVNREREASTKASLARDLEQVRLLQQGVLTAGHSNFGPYRVEAVYHPAQQVGGDFFQLLPAEDGALLAVIGDVSGKGLPAAMTVSMLVGVLRFAAERSSSPAEILSSLNRALHANRRSGFTTCLVLRTDPSGFCIAANAGHLAPYLDGKEVCIDSGLPLGLVPDAVYSETAFHLAPGAQLTFLTDGVVEARSETGELFGFERTAAVSSESAEAIAQVAQQFGPEDDITVLTLKFAGAQA